MPVQLITATGAPYVGNPGNRAKQQAAKLKQQAEILRIVPILNRNETPLLRLPGELRNGL
jgi:hypothetical protein